MLALASAAGADDTFHFAVERLASLADPLGFGTAAACFGDANDPGVQSMAACLSGVPVVATADKRNPWVSLRSHLQHSAAQAGVAAEGLRLAQPESSVCVVLDHRCGCGASLGLPVCLVTQHFRPTWSDAFAGSRCMALKDALGNATGTLSGTCSTGAPPSTRGPGLVASTRAAVVLPARASIRWSLASPALSHVYAARVLQPAARLATQLSRLGSGLSASWVLAVPPVDTTPLFGLLRGSLPPSSGEAAAALHATASAVGMAVPPGTLVVPLLVDWTDSRCPHVPPHAAPERTLVLKSAPHVSCFRPDSQMAIPIPAAVACVAPQGPRPLLLVFTGSVWPRAMGAPPFDLRAAAMALHNPSQGVHVQARTPRSRGSDAAPFAAQLSSSRFCLVARGAGLHSYRLSEAVSCGCVPLVVADGWVMPLEVTDGLSSGPARSHQRASAPAPIEALLPLWPRPRLAVVNATPSTVHVAAAAEALWPALRGTGWEEHFVPSASKPRPVAVTVGPYYLRLREADWWAAERVAMWAERSGVLRTLAARLPVAWLVVFEDPVRGALLAAARRPPPPV